MTRVPALLLTLALGGLVGCTSGADGTATAQRETTTGSACEEVRLGIAAFNQGEMEETVAHFEKAIPLAKAEDDGSARAADLIEAVEYYAALPPEDYLEAAATSPEFAKYKIITLGQCGDGSAPPEDDGPGESI